MSNVTRFPTDGLTRRKNSLGRYAVSCVVSDRFFKFCKVSSPTRGTGDLLIIDVMTGGYHGEEAKKICQLIVAREDLEAALSKVKPSPDHMR